MKTNHQKAASFTAFPTGQKVAIYIRQAAISQTTMGNDLRALNTQLLITFAHEKGWSDENLIIFNDTGLPATTELEKREGMRELISAIEHDEIKVVLISSEYSLYRDATLQDVMLFVLLCQHHGVLVLTPDTVYDFSNHLHVKLFQFRLEANSFVIYARTARRRRNQHKQTKES
jgi:hypothetical protein